MKDRNIKQGLFFLIIAFLLLGRAFDLFVLTSSVFKIILSALLVSFSASSLSKGKYLETIMPLAFVYILNERELMQMFEGLKEVNSWLLIWGSLFLGIALDSMFKKKKSFNYSETFYSSSKDGSSKKNDFVDVEFTDASFNGNQEQFTKESFNENVEDDYVRIDSNFGDRTRYIRVDNFKNGDIDVNFGSLRVYFDQSTFSPEGSYLKVDCNFAKLTIYLPRNVKVLNNVSSTLGSVTDMTPSANSEYTLTISGGVSFGNLKIIYI